MVACLNSSESAAATGWNWVEPNVRKAIYILGLFFRGCIWLFPLSLCTFFANTRSSKLDCYLNIHGFMAFHCPIWPIVRSVFSVVAFFTHTAHKISSFLLCATFPFIPCDFFLTLFGVITMRQSVGTFYVLLLGSSSLPDGFWWGFFSFSQSIPVFYFNLMLSSVGYFGGFCMSIILS